MSDQRHDDTVVLDTGGVSPVSKQGWARATLSNAPVWAWLLLSAILFLALLLRLYRLEDLTGFAKDQARDMFVMRQMVETKTPVLLGSGSSIGDYFRGPAYYYFLLIPYLLGQGSPVSAAILNVLFDTAAMMRFVAWQPHEQVLLILPAIVAILLWTCTQRV